MAKTVSNLRFFNNLSLDVEGVYGEEKTLPVDQNTSLDPLLYSYATTDKYKVFFGGGDVTEDTFSLNIPYADYPQIISYRNNQCPLLQTFNVPWYKKSNSAKVEGIYDI